MTCVDYIQDDWLDQANLWLSGLLLGNKRVYSDLNLDYQDLLLLYALILESAELSSTKALWIPIRSISQQLGFSFKNTQYGIEYLKDNGYLEPVRLFLKTHFDSRRTSRG